MPNHFDAIIINAYKTEKPDQKNNYIYSEITGSILFVTNTRTTQLRIISEKIRRIGIKIYFSNNKPIDSRLTHVSTTLSMDRYYAGRHMGLPLQITNHERFV